MRTNGRIPWTDSISEPSSLHVREIRPWLSKFHATHGSWQECRCNGKIRRVQPESPLPDVGTILVLETEENRKMLKLLGIAVAFKCGRAAGGAMVRPGR